MENTEKQHTGREYTPVDTFLNAVDNALRTVFGTPPSTGRANPAQQLDEPELDEKEKKHAAGLMRVNHCGEVCAQALYLGQALTARDKSVSDAMKQASDEENDHLLWCSGRLQELDSHTSYLNPVWYAGSFALGVAAGVIGDKWSLGFLAETERQVVKHLDGHLQQLPQNDSKSRSIVEQMKIDEAGHATKAVETGAAELPEAVKTMMSLSSKVMTKAAYWI